MSDESSRKPKHRLIYEHVHRSIVGGEYPAGKQLPTDAQLMLRFGTSRPTVARAMRDLEQQGLVERRPGSGSYVRSSSDTASSKLGLLIQGLGETEIFEPICGQLARACQRLNFTLLWGDQSQATEYDGERPCAEALYRWYIDQEVAGVFFAPMELTPGMAEANRKIATALDKAGIVVILLDRDVLPYPQRTKFDLIGIDNFRAGFLQAQHMLKLGSKKIHYLCRPSSAATGEARIAGYQFALKQQGISPQEKWVHRHDPKDPELARKIKDMAPDALLCSNDFSAANLLRSFAQLGVAVPKDIRVMGLDDVKYAQLLSVPLSTIHQPCREIGEAAVLAMAQRLENRALPTRDILLDTHIVVRESCGAGVKEFRN